MVEAGASNLLLSAGLVQESVMQVRCRDVGARKGEEERRVMVKRWGLGWDGGRESFVGEGFAELQGTRYVKIVSLKQYRGGAGFDSLKVLPGINNF